MLLILNLSTRTVSCQMARTYLFKNLLFKPQKHFTIDNSGSEKHSNMLKIVKMF